MTPVDLNRLREARARVADEGPMAALWVFGEAGRALLDDGQGVLWCFRHQDIAVAGDGCSIGQYRRVMGRPDDACDERDAVVVPVKGKN